MESIGIGAVCGEEIALKPCRSDPETDLSSTNESHELQSGHLPIHLAV
jgi:hypothetical protein